MKTQKIYTNTRYGEGSGAGQPPANRWKAIVPRIKAKVKQWRAQFHRYYLALMRKDMAQTTRLTFGYIRLIVFTIGVSQRVLHRQPALPYAVATQFVHDRKKALFRRGAVKKTFRMFPIQIPAHPRRGLPLTD